MAEKSTLNFDVMCEKLAEAKIWVDKDTGEHPTKEEIIQQSRGEYIAIVPPYLACVEKGLIEHDDEEHKKEE